MKAQLLVVQGRPHGKCLTFPPGEFIFGRGPECHVRPDSPSVSRQHCLLRVGADTVHIRDLASTNGTLVNATRLLGERLLEDGDEVQIGPLVLRLRIDREDDPSGDDPSGSNALLPTPPDVGQSTQIMPPGCGPEQDEPPLPDPLEPTIPFVPSLEPDPSESEQR